MGLPRRILGRRSDSPIVTRGSDSPVVKRGSDSPILERGLPARTVGARSDTASPQPWIPAARTSRRTVACRDVGRSGRAGASYPAAMTMRDADLPVLTDGVVRIRPFAATDAGALPEIWTHLTIRARNTVPEPSEDAALQWIAGHAAAVAAPSTAVVTARWPAGASTVSTSAGGEQRAW